ncbi:MAG TPA: hypothetical protein VF707_09310 [Ardenticatenaceae bacterium]|jgi:hypothetical protein
MARNSIPFMQRAPIGEIGIPVASDNLYSHRVGIMGGLVAGGLMALVMAAWGVWSGNSIWYPVNLIAATLLPSLQAALPETVAQFSLSGLLVGTALHLTISTVLGLVFVLLLPTLPGSMGLWALVIGPLLWAGAQFALLPVVNSQVEPLVYEPTFAVAHLAYSLTLGWWLARASKSPVGG